jgi:hypothetical protein
MVACEQVPPIQSDALSSTAAPDGAMIGSGACESSRTWVWEDAGVRRISGKCSFSLHFHSPVDYSAFLDCATRARIAGADVFRHTCVIQHIDERFLETDFARHAPKIKGDESVGS